MLYQGLQPNATATGEVVPHQPLHQHPERQESKTWKSPKTRRIFVNRNF
jgi:hypothetical protein